MLAFQPSFLDKWRTSGFKFILVLPRDKYGVLRPLSQDKPLDKGFTIEIAEIGLLQIADNYFFIMEKDLQVHAVRQHGEA